MSCSNKKDDYCDNQIDRISDLPNNIIDDILQLLNIVDQVRTSILSRKWRYMWISIPQVCFGETFFRKFARQNLQHHHEISRIISEVLLVHNGPIHTFILCFPSEFTISIAGACLDKWLMFLSRRGIKDLKLGRPSNPITEDLLKPVELRNLIQMPTHVFLCQELTHFKICKFKMSVPSNFSGFKCLLDLWLYCIRFDSTGALNTLVSGCPLLQNLSLLCCTGFESIDFSAPNLKVLRILGQRVIKSICLERTKNLIALTLVACHNNHETPSVTILINGLPQIQRLYMAAGYNEIFSVGTISLMLRKSFNSLEHLELFLNLNRREIFLYIVCLLESAPNLVKLVIQDDRSDTQVPYDSEELEHSSNWCLRQLRTMKIIIGNRFQLTMSLIRLILAISPSLETLTFHVGIYNSQLDASMLLSISEDLLQMERASQRAKIVFLHKEK